MSTEINEKLNILIYDKNFNPNVSASKFGIPKYIKWIFQQKKDDGYDIVFYTDQCLQLAKKHVAKKKIAWILEPPVIHKYPYKFIENNKDDFDIVFTFVRKYVDNKKIFYLPNIMTFIDICDHKIHEKSKICSLIFSNKQISSNHKFRQIVVDELTKQNINIDMYGTMVNKFVDNKIDGLKKYMFHIVIENCNIDGYYSEKILDCFLTGTIPIVYIGTNNCKLDEYDVNGIIFFKSIIELLEIIKILNKDFYDGKMKFIEKNFTIAKKYVTPEDYMCDKYLHLFR